MDADLKPILDRLLTLEEGQNRLMAQMTAAVERLAALHDRQTEILARMDERLDQHSHALGVILERLRRS
jgi:hypothetical protein